MEGSYADTVKALESGRKVILVHGNADMDAIGSACALSRAFGDCTIMAPGGIDRVSRMVTEKLGIPVAEGCDISSFDRVVVVDTSSPEQLAPLTDVPKDAIIIDHHMPTGKWDGYMFLCDRTKTACTQVVLRVIREKGVPIDRDIGLALAGGMVTDSGHFQFSNAEMLRDFADVMDEAGLDMDQAFNFTRMDMSMSERIAMMKCVERSRFGRVGDMIVAVSYGGSFEAAGCRALLQAGADVVFVASQRDDTFRISARATQDMVRKGVHLGDMLQSIGTEVTADGGGHGGAAGFSGIGDCEAMLHICMQRTMDVFREIKRRNAPAEADE
jgi:nanoRNase/pAp phosphatase (c-di-AMP/oligoRNAs hydrolase)